MEQRQVDSRLDRITQIVATIGFTGLVLIAILTFYDGAARYLNLPRISGFSDYGKLFYPIIIATCFPAGLLRGTNITIRFAGKLAGRRGGAWIESFGALVTLCFFALLVWQFVLLTLDYQANSRVTGTVLLPLAPWWWITTAIMALCIPAQAYVFVSTLISAITGRGIQTRDQMTSEVQES